MNTMQANITEEQYKIVFKLSVDMLISGLLHSGGDIEEVPDILREMADDYEEEIKKELDD